MNSKRLQLAAIFLIFLASMMIAAQSFAAPPPAEITSATYTVSAGGTASETITAVPFNTPKATFLANLTYVVPADTMDDSLINNPVVSGNTLIVSGGGNLPTTYTVTVNAIPVTFARTDYPIEAGNHPADAITADFNGDGKLDLAVTVGSGGANCVSIMLGNGDGTFGPKTDFAVGLNPWGLCAGDFNGDGKADIAVINYAPKTLSILMGNGDGTFVKTGTDYTFSESVKFITAGDFNGDGKTDLSMGDCFTSVLIMMSNGDGTFSAGDSYMVAYGPDSVITGNFNADGILDLAVANRISNTVSILLGNGDGTFVKMGIECITGNNPWSLCAGDFNGDGKSDLATANYDADTVSILLGNGDGTFGLKTDYAIGDCSKSITTGDFNADGKIDLATTSTTGSTVSVLLGNGDGTFGLKTDYAVGANPYSVAAGHFNGDGYDDLVTANHSAGNVSVLINTTGFDLLAADKAALVDSMIVGANPNLSNITLPLTNPLPSIGSVEGSTITWTSDKPEEPIRSQ